MIAGLAPAAFCQDSTNPAASIAPKAPAVTAPVSNFDHYVRHTYGPTAFLGAGLSAGIAHWKDYPEEWGQGGEGYGKRLAAAYGRKVIKNSVDFSVASLHGEILAYRHCECSGFWPRTGYAFKRAFVRPALGGGTTPALGRFAGAYAAGLSSTLWYPPPYNGIGEGFRRGTMYLGFDAAKNVFTEFWPDIKRKVLRRE